TAVLSASGKATLTAPPGFDPLRIRLSSWTEGGGSESRLHRPPAERPDRRRHASEPAQGLRLVRLDSNYLPGRHRRRLDHLVESPAGDPGESRVRSRMRQGAD